MSKLTTYLLRQITVPFLGLTLFFTLLLFIVRALDSLELVVINGQSAGVWFELLIYTLPLALARAMPFAFLFALIIGFARLINDNEIPMMFAAGATRMMVARAPVLLAAMLVVMVSFLELYATAWGLRKARETIFQIRADMAASMIRPGSFISPADGITLFVGDYTEEGVAQRLLLQDDRNPDRAITYIAEAGSLRRSGESVVLVMLNGTIHHLVRDRPGGTLTTASFSQYSYNLAQFMEGVGGVSYRLRDLYPAQLLAQSGEQADGARAILHERLVAPLFCLAYALILLALLPMARERHRSYGWGIAGAGALCGVLRLAGYGVASGIEEAPTRIPLLYSLPLGAAFIATLALVIGSLRAPMGARARNPHPLPTGDTR